MVFRASGFRPLYLIILSFSILFFVEKSLLAHPGLAVHIEVREALKNDPNHKEYKLLKGLTRSKEIVTVGIPLDSDNTILEEAQFTMLGVSQMQFRIMKRWPVLPDEKAGRVKWVLVDAVVTLKNGKTIDPVVLAFGRHRKGTLLAKDTGDTIQIDTGTAQFTIRKKKFNLFDKVVVNKEVLIKPGSSSGVVLTGTDGTRYLASNDPNISVSIEENGPVRAAILVKGSHYSDKQKRMLDFTMRMHFYVGKSRVRTFYTLRNASKEQVENVSFRSLQILAQTTLQQPGVTIAEPATSRKLSLKKGEKLRLFQGINSFPSSWGGIEKAHWPTGLSGYTLKLNGKNLSSGPGEKPIRLFYAQAHQSGGKAITFGTRFAAGWWPQGLGVDDNGLLSLGLFPEGNDKPYTLRFNSHTTREVLFHFADKASTTPEQTFFRFQYPLIAKAKYPDWYNQSTLLWEKVISFEEEADFAKEPTRQWPVDKGPFDTLNRHPSFSIFRYRDWTKDTRMNQFDRGRVAIQNFIRLRTPEAGGYYLEAEQLLQYIVDRSIYHSDDYDVRQLGGLAKLKGKDGLPIRASELSGKEKILSKQRIFPAKYRHGHSMYLWYYLTGNEQVRESYVDWGEYLLADKSRPKGTKELAWRLFNFVDLYRFTEKTIYQERAWELFKKEVLEKQAKHKTSEGFDKLRGFYVPVAQGTQAERKLQVIDIGGTLLRSFAYLHRYAALTPLQKAQAEAVVEGLTRFVVHELYFQDSKKLGQFGFPEQYALDTAPPTDPTSEKGWEGGVKGLYLAFSLGFFFDGGKPFLDKGLQQLKASAHNTPSQGWFQDLPDRQTLIHTKENDIIASVWRSLPIRQKHYGNGNYAIAWYEPQAAEAFRFKYSDKKIVPWLGFDRKKRSFQFAPTTHTPFFAAEIVQQWVQPNKAKEGKIRFLVVKGLSPSKKIFFSARYISAVPKKEKVPPEDSFPKTLPEYPEEKEPGEGVPSERTELSREKGDAGAGDALGSENNPAEKEIPMGCPGCSATGENEPTLLILLFILLMIFGRRGR